MTTTAPTAEAPDRAETIAVGFCRLLRLAGVRVPPTSTIGYVEALERVGLERRSGVYWAGRSTLVTRPEDIPMYDRAFDVFWARMESGLIPVEAPAPPVTIALDEDDDEEDGEDEGDLQNPEGDVQEVRFSRAEVLTDKDFADCSADELAELSRLMAGLRFTTFRRRSRRRVPGTVGRVRPDLRRTVRWALRHQGEPVRRAFTQAASRPRRLVLVLDVSGSMEPYARALLRFAHAAVVSRGRVEVFALGTRLTRLTRHLTSRDPDAALRAAFPRVKDWAGGTRLGDGIQAFNNEWAIRGMARGSVVVVLSDGWDRGDTDVLDAEMARLHRVTHQLVWVNPLKATPGYAPLAAGMAAALPHVDRFVEGHSFASLEHLAAILSGTEIR